MNTEPQNILGNHPKLYKRLLAMLYDFIIISAIIVLTGIVLITITTGDSKSPPPFSPAAMLIWELALAGAYLIYSWLKNGNTLGMKAWKLKIQSLSGSNITISQGIIRYLSLLAIIAIALFAGHWLHLSKFGSFLLTLVVIGISMAWCIVDKDKLALHERLSKTRIVDTRAT